MSVLFSIDLDTLCKNMSGLLMLHIHCRLTGMLLCIILTPGPRLMRPSSVVLPMAMTEERQENMMNCMKVFTASA